MGVVKKYYIRLDIVRVISCLMVLLYHLNILKGGFLAVCTFFVMSGYLSCVSALKKENFSVKNYYVNRIKKVYFPLLIVVFITVILTKLMTINWINLKQESLSVIFGYNNFWQLNANFDYFTRNINSPFMHFWYISILIQFDLIFPVIFSCFKKIRSNISTVLVFIITIILTVLFYYMSKNSEIMVVYYNTFTRSFSLLFGVCLAILHYKYNLNISRLFKKFNPLIFYMYCLLLIILCIFISSNSKNYAEYMIITTFISTRLIEYSINNTEKGKYDIIIKFSSKISYEIYLVQYPIIFFMQNISINNVLKTIIIIILTIIISFIIYVLINISSNNKLLKYILFSSIILYGSFIIITEKDYGAEMKQLENKLQDNLKKLEEKNNEYINNVNAENEKWNEMLKDMDESKVATMVNELTIVGVGDSVFLETVDELYKKFPNGYFDGKISRSIIGSLDLLQDLKNKGKLSNTLILALSTNGDYSDRNNDKLMNIISDKEIYWVNAVGADDPTFNEKFKNYASNHPNIHIVDWEKTAKGHSEYFYGDGIHVKGNGVNAYVDTIYNTIYNNYLEKYRQEKNEMIQKHENELRDKIAFYGNDVLTNAFSALNQTFRSANFNFESDYTFKKLYKKIKEKVENKTLEYKIVLIFDKNANIAEKKYKKLIELCSDSNIYIVNMTDKKYTFSNENIKIINFYNEIKNNEDYLIADGVHLSQKGNEALVKIISKNLQ